ncbi:hypothetical protein STRIP9103_05308 [Streptomyces ipomoeae 91-03]|uniref:Uncharacterized protein n=1 Tax=Streptomyces ipomoeae 91-03 TaxID=698759 RepID=L1L298_9ACTN|nr:hypothetical protein STRIP9103_05308 [Streptomyces ipomoeae 91-03]
MVVLRGRLVVRRGFVVRWRWRWLWWGRQLSVGADAVAAGGSG